MDKMEKKIPERNISPFGWWVATLIERFEFEDEDKSNPRRRCHAWTNTVIFKAEDRDAAYQKALKIGKTSDSVTNGWHQEGIDRKGAWVFEGLSSLLPIYDKIDPDGTEILFENNENITVRRVKSLARTKEELEVFDDE